MCRSEWHTPQRAMRTSTSVPLGTGQSITVSLSGAAYAVKDWAVRDWRRICMARSVSHAAFWLACKNSRQGDKALDRDFLGARGRLDAGFCEKGASVDAERFEALAQHLAALAKGRLCHLL